MNQIEISKELLITNNIIAPTIISITVSTLIGFIFRIQEHKYKLAQNYKQEKRKELQEEIGKLHGQILQAGKNLNNRFWNLYENHEKNWLHTEKIWDDKNYYLHSFTQRFIRIFYLIRKFENKAIYIDARIGKKSDLLFLKYISAIQWCITDVDLFKGMEYNDSEPIDHFYSDTLRKCCDICTKENGDMADTKEIINIAKKEKEIENIFDFFNNLSKTEKRMRWDRLVCLHLITTAFINKIGYKEDKISDKKIQEIASKINNKIVLNNLSKLLEKSGLEQCKNGRSLIGICKIESRYFNYIHS